METSFTALYGLTGSFLTTNERYVTIPRRRRICSAYFVVGLRRWGIQSSKIRRRESIRLSRSRGNVSQQKSKLRNAKQMVKLRLLAVEATRKEVAQMMARDRFLRWCGSGCPLTDHSPQRCAIHWSQAESGLCISKGYYTEILPHTHIWDQGPNEGTQCERTGIEVCESDTGERECVSIFKQCFGLVDGTIRISREKSS